MNATTSMPPEVDRLRQRALLIGIGALILSAIGAAAVVGIDRSLFSYLTAFVFWTGVALGCLAIGMLHQLSGGGWGVPIRRPLESAMRTLPLMAVLFIPLALSLGRIYEWAQPDTVAGDHILEHKHAYLNVPFFLTRAAFYFGLWVLMAVLIRKWSLEQDQTGSPRAYNRLRALSGPGLAFYALTVTFASVDWVMSLDPHWFSVIFGVLTIGGQGLSALAFIVAVLVVLSRSEPLASFVKPVHFHDLGKLMLAFVMLWAYFNFSQFLIIWAGNLAEEVPWYLRRMNGNWKWVGLMLVVLHFALPFALLLSRDLKRRSNKLVAVAGLIIVMRAVDTIWMIAPEFHAGHVSQKAGVALDVITLVGVGGIWVWWFLTGLKGRPLLPLHDPNLEPAAAGAEE